MLAFLLRFISAQNVSATSAEKASLEADIFVKPSSIFTPTKIFEQNKRSSPTPKPTVDLLAKVNDKTITFEQFNTISACDRAVNQLLGQVIDTQENMLDRLINEELVRQDAEASGYQLSSQAIEKSLDAFLYSHNKTKSDLEEVLSNNSTSLNTFLEYYAQLQLVDQFSRQQTQHKNLTIGAYIQELQNQAHISFGPGANQIIPNAAAEKSEAIITPTNQANPSSTKPATTDINPTAEPASVEEDRKTAPEFHLPLANSTDQVINVQELQGKPIILTFFATWCPYCQKQTPVLIQAYDQYQEEIHFIGIDVNESQEQVQEYMNRMGIDFPVGLDSNSLVAQAYQVSGFPTTFFLDADRVILAKHVGQLREEDLSQYISDLLFNIP